MNTSDDLLPLWIDNAVLAARKQVRETDRGYDALKNKTTTYAKSILFMRNAHREVLAFWLKKQAELKAESTCRLS